MTKQYLHLAAEQTRRLTSVATQLLDFQKVDMGKEPFYPVMADVMLLLVARQHVRFDMAAETYTDRLSLRYRCMASRLLISI